MVHINVQIGSTSMFELDWVKVPSGRENEKRKALFLYSVLRRGTDITYNYLYRYYYTTRNVTKGVGTACETNLHQTNQTAFSLLIHTTET